MTYCCPVWSVINKLHWRVDNETFIYDRKYRLESLDGEIIFENFIKINNTNLSPDVVAGMIKERFSL